MSVYISEYISIFAQKKTNSWALAMELHLLHKPINTMIYKKLVI